MILKSIIISGFKSFGKKVVIDVSHNVTGVVGPNGSGKSNVAEAIRFVLGEQSMKSMRGKHQSDLIFKGSSELPALSRASVELKIENYKKDWNANASQEVAPFLEYDEISLKREVYADGESKYKINDAIVRLRDVQELLALAGIGNTAHTLISQGEADKVLLASSKDRREILEDALGLRVYHLRIKESEKKLDKVTEHLKEIEIIKRELKPQLAELSRQVKIIEARKQEADKLEEIMLYYVYQEENDIRQKRSALSIINDNDLEGLRIRLSEVNSRIVNLESEIQNTTEPQAAIVFDLESLGNLRQKVNHIQNEISAAEAKVSLYSSLEEKAKIVIDSKVQMLTLPKGYVEDFKFEIMRGLDKAKSDISIQDLASAVAVIDAARDRTNAFAGAEIDSTPNSPAVASNDYSQDIIEIKNNVVGLMDTKSSLLEDLKSKETEYQEYIKSQNEAQKVISDSKLQNLELKSALQNEYYQIEKQIRESEYKAREQAATVAALNSREHYLNTLIAEVSVIIGNTFLVKSKSFVPDNSNVLTSKTIFELEKMLQRSKIKLEEAGVVDAAGVLAEYEEIKKRDEFLTKEMEDLKSTEQKLLNLIIELRETLKIDFKKGIEKISFVFNNYFHEVFAGGRAKLHLKESKIENKYTTIDGKEVVETERIEELEIDVDLPDKKVKDLNMLSGGERSLTSIALIFAMSSIAPPPFIVLDETDAALDEQNALRYGKMLSKLAEKSKLLVITHNRQTMNECDLLYGITIASDGASRLLSIKFDK